jgi:hypothetical protein
MTMVGFFPITAEPLDLDELDLVTLGGGET